MVKRRPLSAWQEQTSKRFILLEYNGAITEGTFVDFVFVVGEDTSHAAPTTAKHKIQQEHS